LNSPHTLQSLRSRDSVTLSRLSDATGIERKRLSGFERGLIDLDQVELDALGRMFDVDPATIGRVPGAQAAANTIGEGYVTRKSETSFIVQPRESYHRNGRLPMIDLFCGTGGFSHGFERTGGFAVTAGIDLLPDRIGTFTANHQHATGFCADIREAPVSEVLASGPAPKVVVGGPPCQGFSSLRPFRSLVENDERNSLLDYFALTVREALPDWFVIENVVGLVTHERGGTLASVVSGLTDLGYRVSWRVLNAANYGLPQRRERVIIVGNRVGVEFVWPTPTHRVLRRSMARKNLPGQAQLLPFDEDSLPRAIAVMEAIHDLPAVASGEAANAYRSDTEPTPYESRMREGAQDLTLHEATRHSDRMLEIIRHAGANRSALPEGMTTSGFSSCYSRMEPDEPSVTLTVNFVFPGSNKCIHPYQDRALTPREGARLQGFEDTFKFEGSRGQVVKQIGNAVPPLLGETIARAILDQT